MENQKFYLIQGELYGCMGTDDGGKVAIAYQQKEIAEEALHTLQELKDICGQTIEELQPSEYYTAYKHLEEKISTGNLRSLVKAMFNDQLELGDLRLVELEFNKVIISK